jgi:hypothetical protein
MGRPGRRVAEGVRIKQALTKIRNSIRMLRMNIRKRVTRRYSVAGFLGECESRGGVNGVVFRAPPSA